MNLAVLQGRLLARVGSPGGVFHTAAEAVEAINSAQRLFVLRSLCLEARGTLTLGAGAVSARLLPVFPSLITVLRIQGPSGELVRKSSISSFAARDQRWRAARDTAPTHYALHGFDFAAFYPGVAASAVLTVTYSRGPVDLASAGDVPEIPEEYHPALLDGAEPILRMKEGGQEFAKVLPRWKTFVAAADQCALDVRTRNRLAGYDQAPGDYVDLSR